MISSLFSVSVIIPVYNGESFLKDAVESIQRQDHHPLEIIIVDDGSTDNTGKIASGLKGVIQYVHQSNRGLPATRNRGLTSAQGNVIAFLDVDDLWSSNKLEIQLSHLNRNPSAGIVIGHTQILMLSGTEDGAPVFKEWAEPVLALSVGSALFRRAVFNTVGLFDETQRFSDDIDWFMRARELGIPMVIHKEVTQYYRRHKNNMTNQQDLGNQYLIQMIKKSLDRRRPKGHGQASCLPKLHCPKEPVEGQYLNETERAPKGVRDG